MLTKGEMPKWPIRHVNCIPTTVQPPDVTYSEAAAHAPEQISAARVSSILSGLRPLAIGILAAAFAKWIVAAGAVPEGAAIDERTVILAGGAVPLLAALSISRGRILWIDVTGRGIQVRRLLSSNRVCVPRSVAYWGFKWPLGAWSALPPNPERTKWTLFRVETMDGFRAEVQIATRDAPCIAGLMRRLRCGLPVSSYLNR